MSFTLSSYRKKWSDLYGIFQDTDHILKATKVWDERNREYIAFLTKKPDGEGVLARCPFAMSVISNSFTTQFYITLCKIREPSNSANSLPVLYGIAKAHSLLSEKNSDEASNLLRSTKITYEKIKKARGMAVAHSHSTTSPYAIITSLGIRRGQINDYFKNCVTLYNILGLPITGKYMFSEDESTFREEMSLLFRFFIPALISIKVNE